MSPSHNQKPGHTSPIVAAWEASSARAACRAFQRRILGDMIDAREWRWESSHLAMVVVKADAYRWRAPPADAPTEPRFFRGRWRHYYDTRFLNERAATEGVRREIAQRTEELRRRLPEKVRDGLVALGDLPNIKVIERALRWATAGRSNVPLDLVVSEKIGERHKAKLLPELRKCAAHLDRDAARRDTRSRAGLWLRRITDQLERGEEIDAFDITANGEEYARAKEAGRRAT